MIWNTVCVVAGLRIDSSRTDGEIEKRYEQASHWLAHLGPAASRYSGGENPSGSARRQDRR